VQSKTKYQNSGTKRSNVIYWVLALLMAVVLGWVWLRPSSGRQIETRASGTNLSPADLNPVRRITAAPLPVKAAAPERIPAAPNFNTNLFPRPVLNTFETQLALAQRGISSGSIDGVAGSQTKAALIAFQKSSGLPATGEIDLTNQTNLSLTAPPLTNYFITSNDLARLQPVASTWVGKSQQTALDYETILELVAEKSFASPTFIRKLNPNMDWGNVSAGTCVQVPNSFYPEPRAKAAFLKIHLSGKTLEAFDSQTNLLVHFPCSIAKRVEKRPVGELHVAVLAPNPNYTFDPDVFPESPEAQQIGHKLIIPPGPNNPVGVAWIGLDKTGYGIHGTPKPEEVGRTESHGCFRLANWNAEYLLRLVTVDTPVYVME
jgi:lipoprotein-anchoring transpeptidase ErfK/SrfK